MSAPAISVLMSVYNGERFLHEAVDSVLAQTFTDFEFIIIDDGSTDATSKILSNYAKQDQRVRVFSQDNVGRAESLNRAIDQSRSELLARMDADDISLPGRLERQFGFLSRHPRVGLLGGAVDLVTSENRTIRTVAVPLTDTEIRTVMTDFNPMFPLVVMRKKAVRGAGGYRKALCDADDYDLYLRVGEHSEFASVPEVILKYRIHPSQVSFRKNEHQVECLLAAQAAAALRAKGRPDPLWRTEAVTEKMLDELGIQPEERRKRALRGQLYWMNLVADYYPQAVLEISDRVVSLCSSSIVERKLAANTLIKSAAIYRRSGRLAKAAAAVGRAIVAEPREAGRHLKMAVARRITRSASSVQGRQG